MNINNIYINLYKINIKRDIDFDVFIDPESNLLYEYNPYL
mgnify:FL=1